MKIAISSTGNNVDFRVSDVFGKCPYFIIAEVENKEILKTESIKNESENQMIEAGTSVAQLMVEKKIEAVITRGIEPKAQDVLRQFNIDIYFGEGIIKEVLQDFVEGKLQKI